MRRTRIKAPLDRTNEKKYAETLREIALLGEGIKDDAKDWKNIALICKAKAREILAGKCPQCGKLRDFK